MPPTYELALVLRSLPKPELAKIVTDACRVVLRNGGLVRSVESTGDGVLPFRMRSHAEYHNTGTHCFVKFDAPPSTPPQVRESLLDNVDVVRMNIAKCDPLPLPADKSTLSNHCKKILARRAERA